MDMSEVRTEGYHNRRWSRRKHARTLIRNISYYISGRKTPARILCDEYLRNFMPELRGKVVELGGYKRFSYRGLAAAASDYIVTNIDASRDDYDEYADIMNLPYENGSIDSFAAIVLLEHVSSPQKALNEVQRCLKVGGRTLIVVPAMYPRNPAPEEFFRFSPTALAMMLDKCRILDLTCLGSLFTLNALAFGRGVLRPVGLLMYLCDVVFAGSRWHRDYPCLIAVLAEKKGPSDDGGD